MPFGENSPSWADFSARGRIRPARCGGRNGLMSSGEVEIIKIMMKGLSFALVEPDLRAAPFPVSRLNRSGSSARF